MLFRPASLQGQVTDIDIEGNNQFIRANPLGGKQFRSSLQVAGADHRTLNGAIRYSYIQRCGQCADNLGNMLEVVVVNLFGEQVAAPELAHEIPDSDRAAGEIGYDGGEFGEELRQNAAESRCEGCRLRRPGQGASLYPDLTRRTENR